MNNTQQRLVLRQETVRILSHAVPLDTTLPICPTGVEAAANNKH